MSELHINIKFILGSAGSLLVLLSLLFILVSYIYIRISSAFISVFAHLLFAMILLNLLGVNNNVRLLRMFNIWLYLSRISLFFSGPKVGLMTSFISNLGIMIDAFLFPIIVR